MDRCRIRTQKTTHGTTAPVSVHEARASPADGPPARGHCGTTFAMANVQGVGVIRSEYGDRSIGYNVTVEGSGLEGWIRTLGGTADLIFPGMLELSSGARYLVRYGARNQFKHEWKVRGIRAGAAERYRRGYSVVLLELRFERRMTFT